METTEIVRPCRQSEPADRARALFSRMHTNGTMAELVGWQFVDYDGDALRLGFTPQPIFCNPMGMVHGGFVASMLDETMGSTIYAATDGRQIGATISATIDYVRPTMLGSLECIGRIRHQGKSIAFIEAELFDPNRRLLAKSTASFKMVTMP